MHNSRMDEWMREHQFGTAAAKAERMTWWVVGMTAATMVAEITVGYLSGSMALLADGWHMGTHMFALGITLFAYRFARAHRDNPVFTFGTGKVGSLAGYSSSIVLGMVAVGMAVESIQRLMNPREIHFGQAFEVACVGLVVNLVSAVMLHHSGDEHGHGHEHGEEDGHHHDHNLRAAFIHVVTDALTSVLALAALLCVRFWGMVWADPLIGLLGAVVIGVWAFGLLRDTGRVLLDAAVDRKTANRIRACIESEEDNYVADLHVWSLGGGALSVVVSVVTHDPQPVEHYRALLKPVKRVRHSTIEVVRCENEACLQPEA